MTEFGSSYSCSFNFESKPKAKAKTKASSFNLKLPKKNELSLLAGAAIFTVVVATGIGIGAAVAGQVFIGSAALLGLVVMSERYPRVKYVVQRTNTLIDLIIFAGSVYAVSALGVTLAGASVITGLGYTCLYAPHVRKEYYKTK